MPSKFGCVWQHVTIIAGSFFWKNVAKIEVTWKNKEIPRNWESRSGNFRAMLLWEP